MMLDLSGSPGVSMDLLSDVYEILIVFSEITDGDRAVCLLNYLASSRCSLGCSAPIRLGVSTSFTTMASFLELSFQGYK